MATSNLVVADTQLGNYSIKQFRREYNLGWSEAEERPV